MAIVVTGHGSRAAKDPGVDVHLVDGDTLRFTAPGVAGSLDVRLQRTLRIPDDGRGYPLPPGLGAFPMRRVEDYADHVPARWLRYGGVFVPMYQAEALWLCFQGRPWRPNAIKVGAGRVNAVSGEAWNRKLEGYMVCPPQPWLDGFNTGDGVIRQFVAMPLGSGVTVEGQVTGRETHGGLQILVFEPCRGRFPRRPPPAPPPGRNHGSVLDTRHAGPILDRLVEWQALRAKDRERAEKRARHRRQPVLRAVVGMKLVPLRRVLEAAADRLGVPYVDLAQVEIEPDLSRCLPEHLAQRYGVLPLAFEGNRLRLATVDPLNVIALDDIQLITGFQVTPVLVEEEALRRAIDQHYGVTDLCEVEETMKDISAQDFGDLGLAAGGEMVQSVYPDPHGVDAWSARNRGEVHVHLVDTRAWTRITGEPPPPTPVNAAAYVQWGYPWFELYDADLGDQAASPVLAGVRSTGALGVVPQDGLVGVPRRDVVSLGRPSAMLGG